MVALGKRWAERVAEKWVLSRRVMYLSPLLSALPIRRNANRSLISASFKRALAAFTFTIALDYKDHCRYVHWKRKKKKTSWQCAHDTFLFYWNCKLKESSDLKLLFVWNLSENSKVEKTIALKSYNFASWHFIHTYLLINACIFMKENTSGPTLKWSSALVTTLFIFLDLLHRIPYIKETAFLSLS